MTTTTQTPHRSIPWRLIGWGAVATILALPAIAMALGADVNWGPEDFMVMGLLLGGSGLAIELGARFSSKGPYRWGMAIAVIGALLMVWVNLAVGIIGSEDNAANAMFGGVLAVGLLGALLARFKAKGMEWAMVATAVAQLAVGVIAWVGGNPIPVFTLVYIGIWMASGHLFGKAAKTSAQTQALVR